MHKSRKVLVTGGAGFIGSHVVDKLVNSGYAVKVIDNLSTGNLANIKKHVETGTINFVRGDIRDASLVKQIVKDVDAVLHFAATISVPFSIENPQETYDNNVAGTLNLLASSARQRVGKFVLISSCAVYGEPKYLPIDENHPTCPISPYAETKLAAERYCLGFHERELLCSVILRLFNVYGPRQGMNEYSGVITRFIERVKKNSSPIVFGDGSQTRDFVNVNDVADAVLVSMEKRLAEGELFNIGSGKPTSINELAQLVVELSGAETEICHEAARVGDIRNSYADISKAEKILGYKPQINLSSGLRVLLNGK